MIECQLPSGLLMIDLIEKGFVSLDTDERDLSNNYPLQDEKRPLSGDSITFESIMKSHRKIENILN